jgi:hypothetical protein
MRRNGRNRLTEIVRTATRFATDLAGKHPDKVAELYKKLTEWRKAVGAPMPAANRKK